jgi:hypothetical protein
MQGPHPFSSAMPTKHLKSKTQPMDGHLTMRQAVAARVEAKWDGQVSWQFGHASFQTDDGRVFCFITKDGSLAMKLPASSIEPLLESGDATLLRMGQRSMREWAVLPEADARATLKLLHEAKAFVESLPKTAKRKQATKSASKKVSKKAPAGKKL